VSLFNQIAQQHYAAPPKGWQTKKIKFLADVQTSNVDKLTVDNEESVRLCNYTDVYYHDRITPDLPFMEATATPKEIEKFTLQAGQVFITKDSEGWDDIGIPALVTKDMPGVLCGYHLAIFTPDGDKLDGAFLAWLCRADALNDQFKLSANGVTRFGLGQYPMKNAVVGYPPLEKQKRIAAFLDEKTAQIDALIARKQTLLARLTEKRQAIITQAVTKGLNPAAPLKDSGIDWLGQIPAHWELRGITKCTTRIDYRGATPEKSSSGVFLVTARNIKRGKIDYSLSSEFIEFEDYEHVMRRGKPEAGDVLFTTEAPLGEIATIDRTDIALAQRIIKFRNSIDDLDTYYLTFWMQSSPFQFDLQSRATGSTALGLKASKIVELRCLLPPAEEQKAIVSHINQQLGRIDIAKSQIETSVEHLEKYRAAIVTFAVTGQIKDLQ
jgi:type I restriction enzyme S subunit